MLARAPRCERLRGGGLTPALGQTHRHRCSSGAKGRPAGQICATHQQRIGATAKRHHIPSPEARQQYLNNLSPGPQNVLSLRGVIVEQALLAEIQASPIASGKNMAVPLALSAADVGSRADFSGWEFTHYCELSGAVFHDMADFHGSVFRGGFGATYTDFRGGGYLSESTFEQGVNLSFAHSERQSIGFTSCTFSKNVNAEGVVGSLQLQGSSCSGDLIIANSAASVMLDDMQLTRSPRWRSRRQCIADEFAWRAHSGGRFRSAWSLPGTTVDPASSQGAGADIYLPRLEASLVAEVYRRLRRSLEAKGNEPGAADFYYGEMEMRRRATSIPRSERFLLRLYWLVSGYGLRGLRALMWLLAVVVGLAVLLQAAGFNGGDPPFRDALIYAGQTTIAIPSGNRALTDHLSWTGEVLRIVLRLAGPLLLGLALLAVRNRVKR